MFNFTTQPMAHQLEAFRRMADRSAYALLMEQGTGKTKVEIDDILRLYLSGHIDRALVIAPNNVHWNWVDKEIPTHWAPEVDINSFTYEKDKIPKIARGQMTLAAISYDQLITPHGYHFAQSFLSTRRSIIVLDESQRIKNPTAKRTKKVLSLRQLSDFRRILSGTFVPNSPFDAFSQFMFLDPTILRTSSFFAFKAEYAEMLQPTHGLIKHIQGQGGRVPQVVARDREGMPKYRNLDRLQRLIAPHSFRVLKSECLDLPPKVYQDIPFNMTPSQQNIYNRARKEMRAVLDDSNVTIQNKLVLLGKLQQITSGFIFDEQGKPHRIHANPLDNPRLKALLDTVTEDPKPTIIWAKFTQEIDDITPHLSGAARYDGRSTREERRDAVDGFQAGKYMYLVANPSSDVRVGLTLTRAEQTIYHSCGFNLEHRLQSEDRNHRIGTTGTVVYYDLVARGSIDTKIARALQQKRNISAQINGDI